MNKRLCSVLLCAIAMLTLATAASAVEMEQGSKQAVIQVSADYRDLSGEGSRSSSVSAMVLADELVLDQRYGRNGLASLTDGAKLVAAYDRICAGVEKQAESIELYTLEVPVSRLELVLEAYRNDNPQHYWLATSYNYSYSGNLLYAVKPQYRSELLNVDGAFEGAVNSYLAQVEGMTDPREIALKLHDLLCEDITYVLDATNAHNAYGALVEHKAVCEGYARAYQLLLNRAGIESFVVTGSSRGQGHAWNMVRLGNDWVQTDVTWDDDNRNDEIYHYYFASTSAQMAEDHTMTAVPYALPNCTVTAYRCFTVELGNSFSVLTVDGVAALMKPTQDGRACELEYTGTESIMNWLGENAGAVSQKLGGTGGFGYSVWSLGREYHVTFTGTFSNQCHIEVIIPGKAATCTTSGLTEGKKCSLCGETLVVQSVIPAKGHTEVTVPGKAATCTASGLTEGKKCSLCGQVTKAQSTIPAKGHTEVTVLGKAATCTASGLTEGKKCSVCGQVTKAQSTIPAKGHTEVTVPGKAATCTATGLTDGKKCSVCGAVTQAQTVILAKGHTAGETKVENRSVATCGAAGSYDEVVYCTACNAELSRVHKTVDAVPHTEVTVPGKAATCTATGLTDGKKCSVCGAVTLAQTTIPAKGHTEVTVPGKAATCTASGLTEGKKCSVCGEVLRAQTTIPAKGHVWDSGVVTTAPTTTTQGVKTYTCESCHDTRTESLPTLALFADVPAGAWYAGYVNEATQLGLMSGVGNGSFNPMGKTSRAMFVQVLYAMKGKPDVTFNHPFTDVNNSKWYAKAIQWAYTNQVTGGLSPTTFGPDQNVTREQIALFLYSYAGKPPVSGDLAAFKDGTKVSSWAKNAVIWATRNGIISGATNSDGTRSLNPQNPATRAENATMMVSFYHMIHS